MNSIWYQPVAVAPTSGGAAVTTSETAAAAEVAVSAEDEVLDLPRDFLFLPSFPPILEKCYQQFHCTFDNKITVNVSKTCRRWSQRFIYTP